MKAVADARRPHRGGQAKHPPGLAVFIGLYVNFATRIHNAMVGLLIFAAACAGAGLIQTTGLKNGAVWYDTDGNQIEAHGGQILKIGEVYHWYGASKKLPRDQASGLWCTFGCSMFIHLYTSKDLEAWSFSDIVFNASGSHSPVM